MGKHLATFETEEDQHTAATSHQDDLFPIMSKQTHPQHQILLQDKAFFGLFPKFPEHRMSKVLKSMIENRIVTFLTRQLKVCLTYGL